MIEPNAALPPLVEPAAALTHEETRRYSRHLIIPEFGMVAQQRLKNARVLVIGAGGLGSPALLYLAAAGVGTLGIVDDDTVDESNLQRQVIHGVSDIGSSKAESARRSIHELNPLVTVQLHPVRLDAANVLEIFAGYDLILDGTDNFATRYLVNDAAEILGKPYVWGSILRFDGQVSVFWGRHGPTYRDLYPQAPPAGSVPSCAEGGVLGVLCAQIGSVMVNEAVKLVTGTGVTLLGRVLVLNALDMSWREIRVRKDPAAEQVTELEEDYEAFCGLPVRAGVDGDQEPAVDVRELQRLLAARAAGERDFDLIDVREPGEHAIVSIDGAQLMPRAGILSGENLPARGRELYVHCKSGGRSAEVAAFLRAQGYDRVFNVDGGILAWVREIEPAKVLY
ncbi:molybdopterin-synthase adenylyltransferase MoeB [Arthrobacter sunyaminii]|uniref:Molybdopterin-synthase adenylyltransferase MoeB n=1 Tax=Arthrobacter sunyaminii TaxID=2816859 RepID=A0A975PD22_9MICC|nr:molybdopterin-synthase adenylyltransferase MoeB [Arthrobacter sunyaminii]MBO0908998.1 molybdopterin-synthase adenylyltransferase MoeB [Arthrobacter sunyaminii]QWQ35505.1 molybdopterin-synthase adenylyltransferase MoeB [Arthrobacter sunyaminii]